MGSMNPYCMHTSFRGTPPPLYCAGIIIRRELDTKHYNGSTLRIYKLGSLTTTDLCNNGFLLMVLVYALVNI
jgi:hypothetical protein